MTRKADVMVTYPRIMPLKHAYFTIKLDDYSHDGILVTAQIKIDGVRTVRGEMRLRAGEIQRLFGTEVIKMEVEPE